MSDYTEKMRLKERAEEDIYFAKLDREMIAAMHNENFDKLAGLEDAELRKLQGAYRKDLRKLAASHRRDHEKLASSYGKLLRKAIKRCFKKIKD